MVPQFVALLHTCMSISGGEDFDQRVMEHFIKLYKKKKGKDLRKDVRAVQKEGGREGQEGTLCCSPGLPLLKTLSYSL